MLGYLLIICGWRSEDWGMEMNGDDVMMAQTSDNQDESYWDCSEKNYRAEDARWRWIEYVRSNVEQEDDGRPWRTRPTQTS